MKKVWNGLEQALHKWLIQNGWQEKRFLLAVSGGVDSICLLSAFDEVLGGQSNKGDGLCGALGVATIHHGPTLKNPEQEDFRADSLNFVRSIALARRISFFHKTSSKVLVSEEEMRLFRQDSLKEIQRENNFDFIVLAHHLDDQAETQLLHLIRGCGLQALQGMQEYQDVFLRPFLRIPKSDLLKYAHERKLEFRQDPSNQELHPLRNWLREFWLPELDKKQLGAKRSLFNSLHLISQELQLRPNSEYDFSQGIVRQSFVFLPKEEKKSLIYSYLRHLEVFEVSQGQVEEILKRLDKSQLELIFTMSHSLWQVRGDFIVARKRPTTS